MDALAQLFEDHLSPEAGQRRRAWLNSMGGRVHDTASEYLGPSVMPTLESAAKFSGMMNPVNSLTDSMTAGQDMVAPGMTPSQRTDATGRMLTGVAEVAAPMVAGKMAKLPYDDMVSMVSEGFTNVGGRVSSAADDLKLRQFVGDEYGGVRAWHGSPYEFDRFNMEKIGTGEGAQAYGHGLYFADHKGVAKDYADNVKDMVMVRDINNKLSELARVMDGDSAGGYRNFKTDKGRAAAAEYDRLMDEKLTGLKNPGHMYEVNIDADPADFLDWDAPLSAQPQSVRDAVVGISAGDMVPNAKGSAVYRTLMDRGFEDGAVGLNLPTGNPMKPADKWASERLREAGIPGIRYLDQGSRGAGDGTRNYVAFNDRLVDILGKNGQRTPQGQAQDVLDMLKSGRGSEVTDEMLAGADDMYLFNNYDLPMDEASRMARAGDMGFDTDAYHGTDRSFPAFDRGKFGEKDSGWYGRGATTDTDPEVAGAYANYNEAEIGQQVVPVRLGGGKYMEWQQGELPFGNSSDSISGTKDMQSLGYAGSKMTNDRDLYGDFSDIQTEYVTFDPTNIRSRFARFDPRLKHLANLSAGVGGLGMMAGNQEEIEKYLNGIQLGR